MIGLVIVIHCIVAVLLGIIILMQSGRGGGLTEAFASAESIFGAKTNTFLVKATSALAAIFIVTSLSLAFLSSRKDKSLMPTSIAAEPQDIKIEIPIDQAPVQEMPVEQAPTEAATQQ